MKSLKLALVALSFAFLTSCGGAPKTETTTADTVKTETAAPVETAPVTADSTTTVDTTKKAQ
jgi:uncharacterized protein YcfL